MTSERPSGASQVVRRKLRSSGGDSADLGSSDTAGGGEGLLLLLGLNGAFWKIAGGPVRLPEGLDCYSGERGESLRAGLILGLMVTQVFVVWCEVCSGWLGLLSEALER